MKRYIKEIRYVFEYILVIIPYMWIRCAPWCGVCVLAKLVAFCAWCVPPFRKMIVANIMAAMVELDEKQARRIGKKSCENLMLTLFEFIWLTGRDKRIREHYFLNEEITAKLKAHVAAGERIIFVNPHLGSWEASGLMAPFFAGVKMVAIAKPVRNRWLNKLLNSHNRERESGLKIIFSKGAVRAATKALREGLGVGTLIDQNTKVREGGTFVNFFNIPVSTSKSPAGLMRYCQAHNIPAVIVYGTSVRMPNGRIEACAEYLSRPFEEYESDEAVIQELMDISEKYIRMYPEQYLWMYRRFQHIPIDATEEIKARYPYYATLVGPNFYKKTR